MVVNYKGFSKDYDYRMAEINFDEDKELAKMERIIKVMEIQGYEINIPVEGYALCEVENKDDYKSFMYEFKKAKKAVALWEKFGM